MIGLPEEGALMLRDYEHALFGHTSVDQLLKGLAKVLNRTQRTASDETNHIQDNLHFQKIVSHFYLVSGDQKKLCYLFYILIRTVGFENVYIWEVYFPWEER